MLESQAFEELQKGSAMQAIVRAITGVGLAAVVGGAAWAQSMSPGACYSKAELEARMARDGQVPIIVSTRDTTGAPAAIITSNSTRTLGYGLHGDQTLGVPSSTICVAVAMKDIRLFSPSLDTLPRGLEIKPHQGLDIENVYRHGARVVLAAQSFEKDAQGQDVLGGGYVVLANPAKRGGGAWIIDNQNQPGLSYTFSNFAFTQHAEKLMR